MLYVACRLKTKSRVKEILDVHNQQITSRIIFHFRKTLADFNFANLMKVQKSIEFYIWLQKRLEFHPRRWTFVSNIYVLKIFMANRPVANDIKGVIANFCSNSYLL